MPLAALESCGLFAIGARTFTTKLSYASTSYRHSQSGCVSLADGSCTFRSFMLATLFSNNHDAVESRAGGRKVCVHCAPESCQHGLGVMWRRAGTDLDVVLTSASLETGSSILIVEKAAAGLIFMCRITSRSRYDGYWTT